MSEKQSVVYGRWPSEITASQVASSSTRYAGIYLDGDDLYWVEGRPEEKGRSVVVRKQGNEISDVLPPPWNVRSKVHEYGGGALAVHKGRLWFVHADDQQIYYYDGEVVQSFTNQLGCRFADLVYDVFHQCLYAVREDHRNSDASEPVNELVRILCETGQVEVIASGDDFYAAPAISPDGSHLAWLSWRHPNMPWDETTLWLADINQMGGLESTRAVINSPDQSVFQPGWSPDGHLYCVTDPDGWWQLYRLSGLAGKETLERVSDYPAEMGLPLWQFGMRTYAFENKNRIIATICEQGEWRLVRVCTATGEVELIASPYNDFSSFAVSESLIALIAAGSARSIEVATIEIDSQRLEVCSQPGGDLPGDNWIATAQPISFPTTDNDEAHGFYYPPTNPNVEAPEDDLPPLLVMSHGGPTSATSSSLNWRIQYWTSRGFAVLDVNYRGSTGYGRAYREKLKGRWGIYDVDDVVAGANYLVSKGLADPERLAIRGSSAGGYTTLAALTFRDTFKLGASFYGIGELESLARDTHKFEARYLDKLIGPYPENKDVYIERSPLHHADLLSCPVIFMQGTEDRVVPPEQAELMVAALKKKSVPVELHLFEGEQHGFRQAETIRQTLELELAFYHRFF